MPNANPSYDSHLRSVVKGLSYRFFGTVLTAAFTFVVTGSVRTALLIGSTEVTVKLILFWGHERLWNMIRWGRRVAPAAPLAVATDAHRTHSIAGTRAVTAAGLAQRGR